MRRINLATHLFYPSTAAAEDAASRRDSAPAAALLPRGPRRGHYRPRRGRLRHLCIRHVHGHGTLPPFAGKAEHVPELNNNLWFGLAGYRSFHLCAADLSDIGSYSHRYWRRPPLLHAWLDLDMPDDW
ncbi:hypothetical protein U9M48_037598 [Paspalum notatum var. saurae]|uniref:Uncharacterized protein n=1 Tax=Paspalum notatum var. saurae TaxID=547442 RepID=A0AAQ3UF87_PASNO